MNLGHSLGTALAESVRQREKREQARGAWHQIGQISIQRVREVVEALDPVIYQSWQTHGDERTCPICGQLDGEIWQSGAGFIPPIHDNCRCQRLYHHTEYRRRFIEQWRDVTETRISWEWRTT